jgi:hypothetical protein
MRLFQWIACKIFGLHTWTCKAEEGINPTNQQLKSMKGFADYAKMYCKHCGKESKLNERLTT